MNRTRTSKTKHRTPNIIISILHIYLVRPGGGPSWGSERNLNVQKVRPNLLTELRTFRTSSSVSKPNSELSEYPQKTEDQIPNTVCSNTKGFYLRHYFQLEFPINQKVFGSVPPCWLIKMAPWKVFKFFKKKWLRGPKNRQQALLVLPFGFG